MWRYRNSSCWIEFKSDTHESDTKWQTWNKLQYLNQNVILTFPTNLTHFFIGSLQVHIIVDYCKYLKKKMKIRHWVLNFLACTIIDEMFPDITI